MADELTAHTSNQTSSEALVVATDAGRVQLHLLHSDGRPVSARIAVLGYTPQVGDRVLASTSRGSCFVIGVLHSSQAAALLSPNGARAELNGASIQLLDAAGALIASYDTERQTLTLSAANIALDTPGELSLKAAALKLDAPSACLKSSELELEASSARIGIGLLDYRSERVLARVAEAFVDVEQVLETRARRLRTLVETTLELVGKRTHIRSEEDTRIDGKRVLLG